jgi:hypothetical protein
MDWALAHLPKRGAMHVCRHEEILVDYLHPHAQIPGVRVKVLQASNPSVTRRSMSLINARCAACGGLLSRRELKSRTVSGGDLFDARFVWSDFPPWWKFWL